LCSIPTGGKGIYFSSTPPKPALGSTQSHTQKILRAFLRG
jgi:hypothetical protein